MAKVSLEQYQRALQQWQLMQQVDAEEQIFMFYSQLLKESLAELGVIYAKYETGGVLTFEEMAKFQRLDQFIKSMTTHVRTMAQQKQAELEMLLQNSYEHSYYFMGYALETSIQQSVGYTALTADMINAAMTNPVKGLTLNATLEKHRKEIIYEIQQTVKRGLQQGATYQTMAKALQETFQDDYAKSIRVARTEAHRVNERAALDSMQYANDKGVKSTKTWNNSNDERVRKKTKYNKADHRIMQGQTVDVTEKFDLGDGEIGEAPGNTGYAYHDINCRCFLVYEVEAIQQPMNEVLANVTFEDWKKNLENSPEKRYNTRKDGEEFLQEQFTYEVNGKKEFIPTSVAFTNTKAIAGKGSDTKIRIAEKLAQRYGGDSEEWSKKVGKIVSDKYIFDLHWYERDGKQYEMKLKHRGDKK